MDVYCGGRESAAKTVRSEYERSRIIMDPIMTIFCLEAPA
jgi:hypothetical protein